MIDKPTLTIAIIALVVSLGIPIADRTFGSVLENELQDYYICGKTDDIREFKGGISGTAYSGYPYIDSRAGAKRCGTSEDKGEWIKLIEYAESVGIDPYELLEPKKQKEESIYLSGRFICPPKIGNKNQPCVDLR